MTYKSYCWAFGTTSFRTRNFNKTIEAQLDLLDRFWSLPENRGGEWAGNAGLQSRYYLFMKEAGFVDGDAPNRPKDAREKTSGLEDIGLLTPGRRLTAAGAALLKICRENDFAPDNPFRIAKDSFLYLKQLLKTSYTIEGRAVRPFIVLLDLLTEFGHLTDEEFTYLLPLCTGPEETRRIKEGLRKNRSGRMPIDNVIIGRLMGMENYRAALARFLENETTEALLCEVGMNRKSRTYDSAYFPLYQALRRVFVRGEEGAAAEVYDATRGINIGKWWRRHLFGKAAKRAVQKDPGGHWTDTPFRSARSPKAFKTVFFKIMHLLKAKAMLSDYRDLNRRYMKTTDIVLFADGIVRLDVIPRHFFGKAMPQLRGERFAPSAVLREDRPLTDISPCLAIDESIVLEAVNREFGTHIATADAARRILEENRYDRFNHMIDTRFTDERLLRLLDCFEKRADKEIAGLVTDNADIPTLFEYVLGIVWYKISEREGKILDYMKLSLDADLLPKTHAAGGNADIVYEYGETPSYPRHCLLLEATLTDSASQRRMEMEPVSRHLGEHLLKTGNLHSYCVFATNFLQINVVSDFRSRRATPYYNPRDTSQFVDGMKIIPLQMQELKKIVKGGKTYRELYALFEEAFRSGLPPPEWYGKCIADAL